MTVHIHLLLHPANPPSPVRLLREELGLLQQPGSYVGEVVKVMGTKKVLVKVQEIQRAAKLIMTQLLTFLIMSTSPSLRLESELPFYRIPTN
jgi:ATP-dependent 26S proteasome regulatory subunit